MSTKIIKRSRDWMLTISAAKMTLAEVQSALSNYTYIGQKEIGKGGFEHFQVFIHNKTAIRFETLKSKLPSAHIGPRAFGSVRECVAYVQKSDTKVKGSEFQNGDPLWGDDLDSRPSTSAENRAWIRAQILVENRTYSDLMLNEPSTATSHGYVKALCQVRDAKLYSSVKRENLTVRYISGPSNCGKTSLAYDTFKHQPHFKVTSYSHPFDGYNAEKVMILDEFRGQLDFSYMLMLLDKFPCKLPARYMDSWAAFDEIWLLSNEPFDSQYVYERGYKHNDEAFRNRFTSIDHMESWKTFKYFSDKTPTGL